MIEHKSERLRDASQQSDDGLGLWHRQINRAEKEEDDGYEAQVRFAKLARPSQLERLNPHNKQP